MIKYSKKGLKTDRYIDRKQKRQIDRDREIKRERNMLVTAWRKCIEMFYKTYMQIYNYFVTFLR